MEFYDQIARVKKPKQDILKNLELEYRKVGEKFGYVMVQSPCFLMLKKSESQVAIEVQFGNYNEFEKSLENLVESKSNLCFLIMSSKIPKIRLEDIRALFLKKFEIGFSKYFFIDIEKNRVLSVTNAEWERFSKQVFRPDWSKPGPMPPAPIFRRKSGF